MNTHFYPHRWGLLRAAAVLLLLLALALLLPGAPPARAIDFAVTTTTDAHDIASDGFCTTTVPGCSLRAAIEENVDDGGSVVITVPAGTYNLTLGQIDLSTAGNLTIQASGGTVTINAQANNRVFVIPAGDSAVLSGITVVGSGTVSASGGCIDNSGSLSLSSVTVQSCTATGSGGGIYSDGALSLTNSAIQNNASTGGSGGGVYQDGNLTIDGGSFNNNRAAGSGGGLYVTGDLSTTGNAPNIGTTTANIANSDNSGGDHGGGAYVGGNATLSAGASFGRNRTSLTDSGGSGGAMYVAGTLSGDSLLVGTGATTGNTSRGDGGGIWAGSAGALTNSDFNYNVCQQDACHGGGLYVADNAGGFTLNDVDFDHNTSEGDGGGTYGAGDVTLGVFGDASLFSTNVCNDADCRGGGLYVGDVLTGNGFEFNTNHARASGGGAYVTNAAILGNGSFSNNRSSLSDAPADLTAGGQGGGLYSGADITLIDINFDDNASYYDGGGAYTPHSADVTRGHFEGNICTDDCWGGGIHTGNFDFTDGDETSGDEYHLDMTETSLTENQSESDGGGAYALGPARLTDCTFTGNVSVNGSGGGVFTYRTLTVDSNSGYPGTEFYNNQAKVRGGGAYAEEQAWVNDADFESNDVVGGGGLGGGLYAFNDLWMDDTVFESNTAKAYGGGAYIYGVGEVTDTDFYNNQCTESTSRGGGVYARDKLTLRRTEFINNIARFEGGGLYMLGWVTANDSSMTNVLFARNRATDPTFGKGDAMYLYPTTGRGGAMAINYATIGNDAPPSNGHQAIYIPKGLVTISNTLVASYTTGLEVVSPATASEDWTIWSWNGTDYTGSGITHGSWSLLDKELAFINTTAGGGAPTATTDNYHLNWPSWAIDRAGDYSISEDLDEADRPNFLNAGNTEMDWPDRGAYESDWYINLAISKTAEPAYPTVVQAGDPITYTLVFSHAGTGGVATGVVITDIIPINLINEQVFTTSDVPLATTPGSGYIWTTPEMTLGQSGIITITGLAPNVGGCPVANTTSIWPFTSGNYDPDPDDDVSSANLCIPGNIYLPIITKNYSETITSTATMP